MQKESGSANGVKCAVGRARTNRLLSRLAPVMLMVLAACGTTWHHANRTDAEAAADHRTCAQQAQELVLVRAGVSRTDYRAYEPHSAGSLRRGETPMELHERSQTTTSYNDQFERCMRSKGYSKD